MSKRASSQKKGSKKKREVLASSLRRKTLTTLALIGIGTTSSIFGLFGKNLLQPFKNIAADPLYLKGERMKSKGYPLFLVKGWILSEQDLYPQKKK